MPFILRFPFVFLFLVIAFSDFVFAHGEDAPGPHGGYLKMPGGFHTEIVLAGAGLEVYLLDIQFQNPTVKNSSLKAKWLSGKNTVELSCMPGSDRFICVLPKEVSSKNGRFEIQAQREGVSGGIATYALPLKEWPATPAKKKKLSSQPSHQDHQH